MSARVEYMSMTDYLLHDAVGSSFLRDIDQKCPAYAKMRNDAMREELADSPVATKWDTRERGTAVHTGALEPDLFHESYAVVEGNRNANVVKDDIAANAAKGVVSVTQKQLDEVLDMVAAVRANAQMRRIIDGATDREVVVIWTDEPTGVECKARLDIVSVEDGRVYDLKTCKDASPLGWPKAVANSGYHMQAAHHLTGARAAGYDVGAFGFLCVENTAPYLTRVCFELDEESMAVGNGLVRSALAIYAECVSSGEWPGYTPGIDRLPGWALDEFLSDEVVL